MQGQRVQMYKRMLFKKEIRVTHSAKNNDISKIIYRIIGKKPFAENVVVSSNGETEYNSCTIK